MYLITPSVDFSNKEELVNILSMFKEKNKKSTFFKRYNKRSTQSNFKYIS